MNHNPIIGLLFIFGTIMILLILFALVYPKNNNDVKEEKKPDDDNWLDEVVDSGMFVGGAGMVAKSDVRRRPLINDRKAYHNRRTYDSYGGSDSTASMVASTHSSDSSGSDSGSSYDSSSSGSSYSSFDSSSSDSGSSSSFDSGSSSF